MAISNGGGAPRGQSLSQRNAQVLQTIDQRLESFSHELELYSHNFADALPPDVPLSRFKAVVLTAVRENPDLAYANRRTLFNSCAKAAADGLLPDGRQGALVVYNTDVKVTDPDSGNQVTQNIAAVQWMPMVAGIRLRLQNSGEVLSAIARPVYRNDTFKYRLGDDEFIEHEPAQLGDDRGELIGAYAIIKLQNGEVIRDVLGRKEIEAARDVSRAKNGPMWKNFPWEAYAKTALRRCAKQAPVSDRSQRLLMRDDENPVGRYEPDPGERDAMFGGDRSYDPEPTRDSVKQNRQAPAPTYAVWDMDGVERVFTMPAEAANALSADLAEAAKRGLAQLDGLWESNQGVIDQLSAAGFDIDPLSQLYAETRTKLRKPPQQARGTGGPAPRGQPLSQQQQPTTSNPAQDQVADRQQENERQQPAGDEQRQREPGDDDDQQQDGPRDPPVQGEAADDVQRHPDDDTFPGDRPSQADAGGAELSTTEAEMAALVIQVPIVRGKPDYKTWALAKFMPKVRRQRSSREMSLLLGANAETIEQAKAGLGRDDRADLQATIDEQWKLVKND